MDNKRVSFVYGVGGTNKANSSSEIVKTVIHKMVKSQKNLSSLKDTISLDAPWGINSTLIKDKNYKLKILSVLPNEKLSLQKHLYRSEHWIVLSGIATVVVGNEVHEIKEGEYQFIPKGKKHRIENNTNTIIEIFEIQIGNILEESDIIRYEDKYSRKC